MSQHNKMDLIFIFLLLLGTIKGALQLKLLTLNVPSHVAIGARAKLTCEWKLGPLDKLYSVKWYKDGKEFYRYVPRDQQPVREYSQPGVHVENSDATGSQLMLAPSSIETGGRYRCEVSGERPLFPTVTEHADMTIVALPEHGPLIRGSRPRYSVGDQVQVRCESGKSRPAARLNWYINGEPAPATYVVGPTRTKHEDGLESTQLGLDFRVKAKHFKNGDLKLKCLATIASVYWKSNEESVQGERHRQYDEISLEQHPQVDLVHSYAISSQRSTGTRHSQILFTLTIVILNVFILLPER